VGTFGATLLLIPLVGTQRTFLILAALVALVAALALPRTHLLIPAAIVAMIALPTGTTKPLEGARILEERETEQQYARVIELDDGERRLELNEGQAFHSVWRRDTVLTDNVWDGYLSTPISVLGRPPRSMAILGNGAGTTMRAYEKYFPDTEIDGVEIDGELTELGEKWFGLRERPNARLHTDDARPFLRASERRWEAILVDAYRQPYIPFYLTTKEFFELARERLAPGGVVAINVGHPEGSDRLEKVLTATLHSAFRNVARDPLNDTNTILMGSDAPVTGAKLLDASRSLAPDLRPVAVRAAARLRPGLSGGTVYTDDHAPVEWLVDESLIQYAEKGG